jgi:hypothetical protein
MYLRETLSNHGELLPDWHIFQWVDIANTASIAVLAFCASSSASFDKLATTLQPRNYSSKRAFARPTRSRPTRSVAGLYEFTVLYKHTPEDWPSRLEDTLLYTRVLRYRYNARVNTQTVSSRINDLHRANLRNLWNASASQMANFFSKKTYISLYSKKKK